MSQDGTDPNELLDPSDPAPWATPIPPIPEDLKEHYEICKWSVQDNGSPRARYKMDLIERIANLTAANKELERENTRLKAPVTPMDWSSHCPRSVDGKVLPGNGIEIANAVIASRAAIKEGQ